MPERTLSTEWPYAHVLNSPPVVFGTKEHGRRTSLSQHLLSRCSYCCKLVSKGRGHSGDHIVQRADINKDKACQRCKVVRYCGKECQSRDWSLHKFECEPFANYRLLAANETQASQVEDRDMRLVVRVLVRMMESTNEEHVGLSGPLWDERELSRAGTMADVPEPQKPESMEHDASLEGRFDTVRALFRAVFQFTKLSDSTTDALLLEIFSKIDRARIFIEDYDSEIGPITIGVGVYVRTLAKFSHSCDPDVLCTFDGAHLQLRQVKSFGVPSSLLSVDYRKLGTETDIPYHRDLIGGAERREWLAYNRYVICRCALCLDLQRENILERSVCIQTPCAVCGSPGPFVAVRRENMVECCVCATRHADPSLNMEDIEIVINSARSLIEDFPGAFCTTEEEEEFIKEYGKAKKLLDCRHNMLVLQLAESIFVSAWQKWQESSSEALGREALMKTVEVGEEMCAQMEFIISVQHSETYSTTLMRLAILTLEAKAADSREKALRLLRKAQRVNQLRFGRNNEAVNEKIQQLLTVQYY